MSDCIGGATADILHSTPRQDANVQAVPSSVQGAIGTALKMVCRNYGARAGGERGLTTYRADLGRNGGSGKIVHPRNPRRSCCNGRPLTSCVTRCQPHVAIVFQAPNGQASQQ
jgi:hypothetical protein